MKKRSLLLIGFVILCVCMAGCGISSGGSTTAASGNKERTVRNRGSGHRIMKNNLGKYTEKTRIRDVIHDPVFGSYGRLLFPTDSGYYSGSTLGSLRLIWYSNMIPKRTVEIANYLRDDAASGRQVFYDIYSEKEKEQSPSKKDTGIFFFRGRKNAPTAVISPGGGFMYVASMQDSFPQALALSKDGINAFALVYRPGPRTACEDLSRAIQFLYTHAESLGINMNGYSFWGGSAGARMSNWVGTYGTESFGGRRYPRPAAIVTAYTGLSETTGKEPPTYAIVGTSDGIANYRTMQRRIRKIRSNGTIAEIEVFRELSHGFGTGEGTVAEGWLQRAERFWLRQRS